MQTQSDEFHRKAVGRLFVAIVNQAILDLLEDAQEAEAAERWLLSKDCDELQSRFVERSFGATEQ